MPLVLSTVAMLSGTSVQSSVIHRGRVKPIRIIRQRRITSAINYETVQRAFIKVNGWGSRGDWLSRHAELANGRVTFR